jgi:hypothetical protein
VINVNRDYGCGVQHYSFFLVLWPLRRQIQQGKIFRFWAIDFQATFPVPELENPVFCGELQCLEQNGKFSFELINNFPDRCDFYLINPVDK